MTTTKFRTLVGAVIALALLMSAAGYLRLWTIKYASNPNGIVVLIVNSAAPEAFSTQVMEAVRSASTELGQKPEVQVVDIGILPGKETEIFSAVRTFYDIVRKVGERPVLGAISATTSLTDRLVISVCKTLRVPLLLTVATNDELLNRDTDGIVFRLPPNNTAQIHAMASWARANGYKRVGLLYETNAYGNTLRTGLLHALRPQTETIFPVAVSDHTDFSSLAPPIAKHAIDLWVFLGYLPRAADLLESFHSHASTTPVLLSDGSISDALGHLRKYSFPLYVSVPNQSSGPATPELLHRVFGTYGRDAYLLLAHLSEEARSDPQVNLRRVLSDPSNFYGHTPYTTRAYAFTPTGESQASSFSILKVEIP